MHVTLVTRLMCSACEEAKEILESYEIKHYVYDADTREGMSLLSMHFSGPDTLLPAIICQSYSDMEMICQIMESISFATIGVEKE